MFHIDGTQCLGPQCKSHWCTRTEPMSIPEIRAEMARVAREKGWVK